MSLRVVAGSMITVLVVCLIACSSVEKVGPDIEVDPVDSYIRDFEYQEGRIFDLGYPGEFDSNDTVSKLYVFEEITSIAGHEHEVLYNCIVTISGDTTTDQSRTERRIMVQLDEDEFTFCNDFESNEHYVVLDSPHRPWRALGVYMEINRGGGATDVIGDLERSDDSLVLKMIRPCVSMAQPSHPAWNLMWRNVYAMPRGVDIEDLNIRIFKGLPGTENSPLNLDFQEYDRKSEGYYTGILGLDQINNNTGVNMPDGKVDPSVDIFRPDWGLLIFPHRTPFASDTTFRYSSWDSEPLREHAGAIYSYNSISEKVAGSLYYVRVTVSAGGALGR